VHVTISLSRPADSARDDIRPTGLTIKVSRGTGTGSTRLAAFDAALRSAGVADFNLVRLSSVIPPYASVTTIEREEQISGGHGDLLFCVYADAYSSTPGESAWAGITWSRHPDPAEGGLFAEHSGWSRADVERELELTMAEMMEGRQAGFRADQTVLSSITCETHPVCALVIASYRRVSWGDWGIA
jgi:arginine decarboxylase